MTEIDNLIIIHHFLSGASRNPVNRHPSVRHYAGIAPRPAPLLTRAASW